MEEMDVIKHVPGFIPSLIFHPLSKIASAGSHKNGGNPFNIKAEDGPLMSNYLLHSPQLFKSPTLTTFFVLA